MGILGRQEKELAAENEKLRGQLQTLENRVNRANTEYQKLETEYLKINNYAKQVPGLKAQLQEARRQAEYLIRRCEGLQNAVAKWQAKAKKEPVEESLITAKRRKKDSQWHYAESWTIPIPADPGLARDAWAWCEQKAGRYESVERIYYSEKHGWVAVVKADW